MALGDLATHTRHDATSHTLALTRPGNLAIHSACERQVPSAEVITLLADCYPEGLQKADKTGNLPLHSVLERGDSAPVEAIRHLLKKFPGATKVKDKDGNTPLHCAFHCMKKSLVEVVGLLLDTDGQAAY